MVLFYAKIQDKDYPHFYIIPTLCVSSLYNNNVNVLTSISFNFCTFEFGVYLARKAAFTPGSTKDMLKDIHDNVMKSIDEMNNE